jgi:hypothetical protein
VKGDLAFARFIIGPTVRRKDVQQAALAFNHDIPGRCCRGRATSA